MSNEMNTKDPTTQNTIMFASTVPAIFDSIHSSIHQTIRSQVATLPIIQSSSSSEELSCEEQIYKAISNVYSKHMDVAQLYAEHELFCIDNNLTRGKREQIVNAFLTLEQRSSLAPDNSNSDEMDGGQDDNQDNQNQAQEQVQKQDQEEIKFRYSIPDSKEDIPTAEEMAKVKQEINHLRQQLRQVTIEKQKYQQQILFLDQAKVSSADVDSSISKIIGAGGQGDEMIIQSIKAANEDKKHLKELTSTGQDLIQQMDILAEEKEDNNDTEEFSEAMKAKAFEVGKALENKSRPKKRSIEEDYKERNEKDVINGNVMKLFKE
jgi:hypothetical protein